ncbi:acyl carrier protein [Micromonospora cathayae]|uniref:Acyl carrier protein n=1 Tax=Micromonospora cathayae TaxID=3028804 RepID=A0ABY7ZSF7_9ACTN|nr:acyl carrier protein [Micromonospora sp. HUAS 3]WDZ85830.1 acyl carrier protein [Micromonospora sp. HUAS 3]
MERETFQRLVTEYLTALDDAGEDAEPLEIRPDDNLFDVGVVTSLSMIKLIGHISDVTGTSIDLSRYSIESFYTIDSIYDVVERAAADHVDA